MKLTDRQKQFIEVYRKYAGNVNLICKELGMTPAGVQSYLQTDKVKEELNKSIQIAREKIERATPYLIDKAIELVNSENVSDKVKSQIINSLLEKGGIITQKNSTVSININTEISDRARKLFADSLPTLTVETPVTMRVSDNS